LLVRRTQLPKTPASDKKEVPAQAIAYAIRSQGDMRDCHVLDTASTLQAPISSLFKTVGF